MANVKITDLTALSGADVADADVFVIVDVNADQTKKLTRTASKIAISDANDFVTYTRLNANIDIVQDNVASASSNAISSGDTVVNTIDPIITFVANGSEAARFTTDGNLFIGTTGASPYFLDVRGTANVGTLTVNTVDMLSNDFVTYTRLNANVDIVQDNVAGILDGATFTGEVTMNDDLLVQGNLAVHGDTITSNAVNLVIQDPIVMLANGTTGSPTFDVGFLANRGNQGNAFFGYDESYRAFTLAETKDPVTNVNIHPTSLANLVISNLTTTSLTIGSTLLTPTGIELNYVDGVTSAIQTQIDTKIATTDSASNDFVTYARLNANINVVSGNVDTAPTQVAYTTSTSNTYPITVSTSSIAKTQVYLDGIYQAKAQYILANSSSNVQFKISALVADLSLEIITLF